MWRHKPFKSNLLWSVSNVSIYVLHLSHRDVLGCLAVVLEDDRDVHVDDDEEADDQVGEEEGDGHDGVTTVSLVTRLGIRWKEK